MSFDEYDKEKSEFTPREDEVIELSDPSRIHHRRRRNSLLNRDTATRSLNLFSFKTPRVDNPFRPSRSRYSKESRSLSPMRKRPIRSLNFRIVLNGLLLLTLVIGLIVHFGSQKTDSTESKKHYTNFDHIPSLTTSSTILSVQNSLEWYQQQGYNLQTVRKGRALSRIQRTRPPTSNLVDHPPMSTLNKTPLDSYDQTAGDTILNNDASLLSDLCGAHAKNVSTAHPMHFSKQYALKRNSIVLMTGILSPLGFHLATKLAQTCHVEVITAIDPMYPNTYLNLLRSQEKISTLTKLIPQLKLPIAVPFVGLDFRNSHFPLNLHGGHLNTTQEMNLIPPKITHVIHLSTSDPYLYRDFADDRYKERYELKHSYFTSHRILGHWFGLRQSLTSMEQLLMSLAAHDNHENIQVTFISASEYDNPGIDTNIIEEQDFFLVSKSMDEMMARTYSNLKQVSSVALRLPTVYGPMGRQGSIMYELAEAAAKNHRSPQSSTSTNNNNQHHHHHHQENHTCLLDRLGYQGNAEKDVHDLLFVDDAVDSILTAMQYHNGPVASTLEISSGRTVAMKDVVAFIEQQMDINNSSDVDGIPIPQIDIPLRNVSDFLLHTSQIPLETGLNRLLSWHLDKNVPYGSASDLSDLVQPNTTIGVGIENGNDFLTRVKGGEASLCAANDSYCLRGKTIYPCMSECASLKQCKASPYDAIKAVSWSASFQCRTVVYTAIFGKGIVGMNYSAPSREEGDRKEICGIAFVSQESALVLEMITKVTRREFEQMNVIDRRSEETDSVRRRRLLIEMNGRLSCKGWRIIWMDQVSDVNKIEHSTTWLAALSPRRLFHPSVKFAMYISHSTRSPQPSVNDVLFLTSQMWRQAEKPRKVSQRIGRKRSGGKELLLESEPERKVGLLVGALRLAAPDHPLSISPWKYKVHWLDARMAMAEEIYGEKIKAETVAVQNQREFYERISPYVNNPHYRSGYEPMYEYDFFHWAGTQWLLHDLDYETSRKFRCDWYQEHLVWGTEYDQLSLAHVMARREVERKVLRREPDDITFDILLANQDPDLDLFTDRNSWHLMIDPYEGQLSLSSNGVDFVENDVDHRIVEDDQIIDTEAAYAKNIDVLGAEDGIYVRILTDLWGQYYRDEWKKGNQAPF